MASRVEKKKELSKKRMIEKRKKKRGKRER